MHAEDPRGPHVEPVAIEQQHVLFVGDTLDYKCRYNAVRVKHSKQLPEGTWIIPILNTTTNNVQVITIIIIPVITVLI